MSLTSLCVERCPGGPLSETKVFGGYGPSGEVPSYEYSFTTSRLASRCLPVLARHELGWYSLCLRPTCSEARLVRSLNGSVASCAKLTTLPDLTDAWFMCDEPESEACAAQRASCEHGVRVRSTEEFSALGADDDSAAITKSLARLLTLVLGVYEALLDARLELIVARRTTPISPVAGS